MITIYGGKNCQLCEEAKELADRVLPDYGMSYEHINIREDEELSKKYDLKIPVMVYHEHELAFGKITEDQLRSALDKITHRKPDFAGMLPPEVLELAKLFPEDEPLYLVGGAVRDILLESQPTDLDFTTALTPDKVKIIVAEWSDEMWTVGERFGTIAALKGGIQYEITTFRAEQYDDETRKPEVAFSKTIEEDLVRRDFTVNAMAWGILEDKLYDLFEGRRDLKARVLRTPGSVEVSFRDDPLRMMRALRYHAALNFSMSKEIIVGIQDMGSMLAKVSAERVADELLRTLLADKPSSALRFMHETKLCLFFLPELTELEMDQPGGYHHKNVLEHTLLVVDNTNPESVLRLAALFHDIAKPRTRQIIGNKVSFHHHEYVGGQMTRQIMKRLRFSKSMTQDVATLVEMHLRPASYRDDTWTDSAVRRYIRDAGSLLDPLNALASADCTSLNPRVAQGAYERQKELEHRIAQVREAEDIAALRPMIDGNQIMKEFDIAPGRVVGQLRNALLDAQVDGDITEEDQAWEFLRERVAELQDGQG